MPRVPPTMRERQPVPCGQHQSLRSSLGLPAGPASELAGPGVQCCPLPASRPLDSEDSSALVSHCCPLRLPFDLLTVFPGLEHLSSAQVVCAGGEGRSDTLSSKSGQGRTAKSEKTKLISISKCKDDTHMGVARMENLVPGGLGQLCVKLSHPTVGSVEISE